MPLFTYNRRMIRYLYTLQGTPQRIILSIRSAYGNRPPSPAPCPGPDQVQFGNFLLKNLAQRETPNKRPSLISGSV